MYRRPKRDDTEDDIMRMQEAFLNEKEAGLVTAAEVVDCRETKNGSAKKRGLSKYAKSKGLKRVAFASSGKSDNVADIAKRGTENNNDNVYFPEPLPSVLGEIVERSSDVYKFIQNEISSSHTGFPTVSMRDRSVKSGSISIFAQQANVDKSSVTPSTITSLLDSQSVGVMMVNEKSSSLETDNQSRNLSEFDADMINNQNLSLLKELSEKEILEEKYRLESSMDPSLVAFIKSKRHKVAGAISCKPMETSGSQFSANNFSVTDLPMEIWENDILCHPNLDQWLNFDKFEKEKHQWMESMSLNVDKPLNEPYEARFDLKGWLMPYTIEYSEESKVLYHHGEEPHRPGYTIDELFSLSRSVVIQQKVVAVNTLAGILEYYNIGAYQDVCTLPVSKIYFALRFTLDDNKILILEPTLKALRNLFYNRVDEACLDGSLAIDQKQPNLEKDKSEIKEIDSDQSELKDFHLAEIDLVAGAIRTDILIRLRYILNNLKPNFNCVQYCLQILSRFARDSDKTVTQIIYLEHFITAIIENFLPISPNLEFDPNTVYGKPVTAALKLIRILVSHSRESAQFFFEKCNCTKFIKVYISVTAESMHALKIQVEALHLWSAFLFYGFAIEDFLEMIPPLLFSIDRHVSGTDIPSSPLIIIAHASALFSLFSSAILTHDKSILKEMSKLVILLETGYKKWITQVTHLTEYFSAYMLLPSALLTCMTNLITITDHFKIDDNYYSILKVLFQSKIFSSMVEEINVSSNLISKLSVTGNITNLHDLGSSLLCTSQKVLPCVSAKSPLHFLSSLLSFVTSAKISTCSLMLLDNLKQYILKIIETRPLSLLDNWFSRIEISLLLNIIKMTQTLTLPDAEKDLVFLLSHKILYFLGGEFFKDLKTVFTHIIFDKDWFSTERLMKNLNLSMTNSIFNELQTISLFYYEVLNFNKIIVSNNLKISWKSTIVPKDWIYLPIVALYSKSQELPHQTEIINVYTPMKEEHDKIHIIKSALRWIIFSEIYFPEQMSEIKLTDRLCRIMCVFLCDSSLFLDIEIKELLRYSLDILFRLEKKLGFNFDENLEGLSNFQDFYTQFVDHFQAVSYGDENFASCMLVPLAQKHNIKWKKLVWSEYVASLRALDCSEAALCYPFDDYVYPEEQDKSLLKCYHRALQNNLVRPGTLMHRIATHHVEKAISRKN